MISERTLLKELCRWTRNGHRSLDSVIAQYSSPVNRGRYYVEDFASSILWRFVVDRYPYYTSSQYADCKHLIGSRLIRIGEVIARKHKCEHIFRGELK